MSTETGWQPIETAPKDGAAILGFGQWAGEINGILPGQKVSIIEWAGGSTDYPGFDWRVSDGDAYACWLKPSHWMPLPAPPVNP
jgi:hypothetical protein